MILLCGVWLLLMAAVSYFSYTHKLPVRIQNWQPQPDPHQPP